MPPPPRKTDPPEGIADRSERRGESELPDHLGGELGAPWPGRWPHRWSPGRARPARGPAPEQDGQRVGEVVLAVEVALDQGELLGDPEGLPGRKDRHLGDRVGLVGVRRHQGVAGLVHGHGVLLLGEQHVGALPPAEDDPVPGLVEVDGAEHVPVGPHGDDGRLVDQVGQIGPGEAGRPPRHHLEVHARVELLAPAVDLRIATRSGSVGSGMMTWRSNRPGRSRAGSSTSGRLVAARTTMPVAGSKPSISASSWLRVCSRSSLETTTPVPPRRWPMASISSTKMMAGARLRASWKRSRTRAAPTPTNISTKLEPVTEKNGTVGLAGHGPGQQGLAGARRADHQDAPGGHGAGPARSARAAAGSRRPRGSRPWPPRSRRRRRRSSSGAPRRRPWPWSVPTPSAPCSRPVAPLDSRHHR